MFSKIGAAILCLKMELINLKKMKLCDHEIFIKECGRLSFIITVHAASSTLYLLKCGMFTCICNSNARNS